MTRTQKKITIVKEVWIPGFKLHRFWQFYFFVFCSFHTTAIRGEHNIKGTYPSMHALHCLENLYALILPSDS